MGTDDLDRDKLEQALTALGEEARAAGKMALAAGFYPEARVSGKLALALDVLWREVERRDQDPERRPPAWHPRRGGG